ncbi:hypothetical protein [Aminobacter ciceronei]|uniref:hypothetical protein n=1 Tax=Aminobacter ciceronei TaxID=150723 RepID=UPI0015FA96A9|nr:hypothetical protein [Aminobacter ciceronei]
MALPKCLGHRCDLAEIGQHVLPAGVEQPRLHPYLKPLAESCRRSLFEPLDVGARNTDRVAEKLGANDAHFLLHHCPVPDLPRQLARPVVGASVVDYAA